MNEREAAMSHPPRAELMIVTGMSGAGRSTAANVLEDQGWYVVDNLPPQLLPDLAGLVDASAEDVPRLAAVVDVRSRAFFTDFRAGLERLRDDGWRPSVVFMDATDEALVRRFESVRRPHPLQLSRPPLRRCPPLPEGLPPRPVPRLRRLLRRHLPPLCRLR